MYNTENLKILNPLDINVNRRRVFDSLLSVSKKELSIPLHNMFATNAISKTVYNSPKKWSM